MGSNFLSGGELTRLLESSLRPHPRLFLPEAGEEEPLTRRLEDSPALSTFAKHIIEVADGLAERPVLEREIEGRRLLKVSRECLRRILYWGVAYRLTEDETYATRAAREMLAVAAFQDWNPSHFLDVGEMTAAMGIGYDWFYDVLDTETRTTIREAIVNLGLKASFGPDMWWVDSPINWSQVCHGGLVLGALAVYEDAPDISFQVLQRALEHADAGLSVYAPDGAYPEGPTYWSYGTSYSVMMIAAFETALGSDFDLPEAPGFMDSAEYILHAAGPTGLFFNYSDCGLEAGIMPELYWFAQKLDRPELIWGQWQNLQRFNAGDLPAMYDTRMLPFLLIWAGELDEHTAPGSLHWQGDGETPVAFHRTSWTDPGASFVAIKGGSPMVSHAHMDIGQFVMESDGVRWAADLGMQSYHELESIGLEIWGKDRWKVFRINNLSHSVLVVDSQPQGLEGSAQIVNHEVGQELAHTILDMSEIYAGQLKAVRRGVALHENGVVQIEDVIELPSKPTMIRWGMVTHADITIEGACRATLRQDGESLSFEILSAPGAELEIFEIAEPPNEYDSPNPGAKLLGFTVSLDPATTDTRIAVALIPGSVEQPVQDLPAMCDW